MAGTGRRIVEAWRPPRLAGPNAAFQGGGTTAEAREALAGEFQWGGSALELRPRRPGVKQDVAVAGVGCQSVSGHPSERDQMRRLLLVLVLLLAGCYRYVPYRPDEVTPGAEVRVHLSNDGARRVTETYPYVTGAIEGRLE